ncbi:MAG: hypothetical protein A2V90_02105 [Gammaproteobacteria bacterium RBG_16_57_12]|nr:MAG: hypothetical protein A2V90_02105 [Gammaproteobacteria bacterium RBG_16_57_12]
MILSCLPTPAYAETLNLDQAVQLALTADQRIKEREHLVEAARSLLSEVTGNEGFTVDANAFVALAPRVDGGFYRDNLVTCNGGCEPRSDLYDIDGVVPWTNLSVTIVKPLYTFGKIENYAEAARGNIDIKQADVTLQRGNTILDVHRAYYGYLTARETRKLLADVERRIDSALELVNKWLADGSGDVRMSDRYALESGLGLVRSYLSQAGAVEHIALDGLKVLTGIGMDKELEVSDTTIRPVALPEQGLAALQEQALARRPEMIQVESGLRARRSLVAARDAEGKPNIYAGIGARAAYTPGRDSLENPHVFDIYNHAGLSPVLGIKWDFNGGVKDARVAQEQAQLEALLATAAFARQGIPYQVSEQYLKVQSNYERTQSLEAGSRAGRRWMIGTYADFEAGLEKADKVITAFQGYVLAHSDYLKTVYDYNMDVVRLKFVTGELQ